MMTAPSKSLEIQQTLEHMRDEAQALAKACRAALPKSLREGPAPANALHVLFMTESDGIPDHDHDPVLKAGFTKLFADLEALPDTERMFIYHGIENAGPPTYARYARGSAPHQYFMHAFIENALLGISFIIHERAQDIALRHFYVHAFTLVNAAGGVVNHNMRLPKDPIERAQMIEINDTYLKTSVLPEYARAKPLFENAYAHLGEAQRSMIEHLMAANHGPKDPPIQTLDKLMGVFNTPEQVYTALSQIISAFKGWPYREKPDLMSFNFDEKTGAITNVDCGWPPKAPKLN